MTKTDTHKERLFEAESDFHAGVSLFFVLQRLLHDTDASDIKDDPDVLNMLCHQVDAAAVKLMAASQTLYP